MDISNQSLHQEDKKNYLPTFNRLPLAFIKGKGSRLWDADGKQYIDMLAGIAVNNVGHCHPKVVKAISDQASQLMHISNFFVSPPQVALSKLLVDIAHMDHVFLTNSGAESVEGAIKIARKFAHSKGKGGTVLSMENSFHGRTLATIATGQPKYQKGFAPIPHGFGQVPFNDFDAVTAYPHHDVAAILVEPIQGEGGIRPAERMYLQKLRNYCDEYDILLIFDEIQCGVGRTGFFFAKDYYGVQPDIMTLAKALGGGMPIGAFLCNSKVGKAIEFGDHGTTFGGNPLACAAALATLRVIQEEDLLTVAQEKGDWLMGQLNEMKTEFPMIKEVRGLGLMIGVELDQPAAPVMRQLMDQGIIANATAERVLRLVPPLNIPKQDLETFLEILKSVFTEMTEHAK